MFTGILFEQSIIIRNLYNPAQVRTILFVLQIDEKIPDRLAGFRFFNREIPSLLDHLFNSDPCG